MCISHVVYGLYDAAYTSKSWSIEPVAKRAYSNQRTQYTINIPTGHGLSLHQKCLNQPAMCTSWMVILYVPSEMRLLPVSFTLHPSRLYDNDIAL